MSEVDEASAGSRGSLNARTGRVDDVNDVQAGDFLWTTESANHGGFGFRVLWGPDAPKDFANERDWIRAMMPDVFWDRDSMERTLRRENASDQRPATADSPIQDRAIFCQKEEDGGEIIPLYRKPTLTDEEREAIRRAISRCTVNGRARRMSGMDDLADEDKKDAEAFIALLKRLG